MAPDTWLPQLLLAVALLAAMVRLIRGQVLVPIADRVPARRLVLPPEEDELEHPVPRKRRIAWLPMALALTAAIRVGLLVTLHR